MTDQENKLEKIGRRLEALELRLGRIETVITSNDYTTSLFPDARSHVNIPLKNDDPFTEEDGGLESQIGRFGLAWIGNIVLLFGITFLTEYLMIQGIRYLSVLLGYVAAGSIFYLALWLRKTNSHLAFMFKMNAQILLFYITVRLHFFSASPVISNEGLSVILLLLIAGLQAYMAIRELSQAFGVLSVLFVIGTAVLSDSTHIMLLLLTLVAAGSVFYYYWFNWKSLVFTAIILSYSAYFIWLFGNPLMGHPMQILSEHHSGVIYLFGLGLCFSMILLFRKEDSSTDDFLTGVTFANGILFTFLLLLVVIRFFSTSYVSLFAAVTICCLAYSTLLHSRSDWNFATAFYALYAFMAMSISLYGLVGFPQVYLLLSVQSLIVVSMALWFRNRLIVVMNSFLFLTIFTIYFLSAKSIDGVNFSFALISLISARIINWKKTRLQIKTDFIRNLYLIEGFFIVMYALLNAVPKHFVTLSWTIAALIYFLLSFILKNVKYRYMALGTMICAAVYLFLFDLAGIEIIYRVLALLFLAAISIGISMYYTNRIRKSDL
jgi:hypothetical protein